MLVSDTDLASTFPSRLDKFQQSCSYMYFVYYSGPSLSGHSHERPPCLMWRKLFTATAIHVNTLIVSTLSKATSLMWPQFPGQYGGHIRGGLLYIPNVWCIHQHVLTVYSGPCDLRPLYLTIPSILRLTITTLIFSI